MSAADIAAKVVRLSPISGTGRFAVQHWEDWAAENPHKAITLGVGDEFGAKALLYERQRVVSVLVVEILKMCMETIRKVELTDSNEAAREQIIAAIENDFALPTRI
jgi:hypothetical protein